jgi:hypothetical protein
MAEAAVAGAVVTVGADAAAAVAAEVIVATAGDTAADATVNPISGDMQNGAEQFSALSFSAGPI